MKNKLPRTLFGLAIFLALNGAYLATHGDPTLFYVGNVVLHLVAGLVAYVLFIPLAARVFKGVYGRPSAGLRIGLGVLTLSLLFGGYIAIVGATAPDRWALHIHVWTAIAGLIIVGVSVYGRLLEGARTRWRKAVVHILAIHVLVGIVATVRASVRDDPLPPTTSLDLDPEILRTIRNPYLPPANPLEEGGGPEGLFFPASVETASGGTIPADFLMNAQDCRPCHDDIVDQWESSAHHLSSFNNQWYRKSIEYMQEVVGVQPSKWCGGCHDTPVLINGMMNSPVQEILDRPQAHAGLQCTACHSIVHVKSTMGNSDYVIEYPPMHDLVRTESPLVKKIQNHLLKLDPEPHRRTFLQPLLREASSEFCSSCHKVHLDVPVNNYRWFRGFDEYDGWQNSGVSHNNARAFYYPPEPMGCTDCHMPLVPSDDMGNIDGFVHNHRFPGANTALPFVNDDHEQLKITEEFLKANVVTVDIFALSQASEDETLALPSGGSGPQAASITATEGLGIAAGGGAGVTDFATLVAPLGGSPVSVRRGDTVRLDVVVRTRGVGHFFPGGTIDAFDVWVELKAEDETGRTVFWSGEVEELPDGRKGHVDPGAHFYRSVLLDGHGNKIDKRNAWAARSVLYARMIPPGAADTVHYRLQIPEDCGEEIRVTARLNYRKFSWQNTQFAYAGVPEPDPDKVTPDFDDRTWTYTGDTSGVSGKLKEIPDLPIVTMSEDRLTLRVGDPEKDPARPDDPEKDWERWNDFGIGLLLQGDLRGAEQAFRRVTALRPDYAMGWVNVARPLVREGRIEEARVALGKALEIDPDHAGAHYFASLADKSDGLYDSALDHLERAASHFPRDRVVLNQIGRIRFLRKEYDQAVEALQRVIAIDPEDLQAHYNLMLCYRGLRDDEKAARHEGLYRRFKLDESSQALTGEVRRTSPEDNNERQAIHEHGEVTVTRKEPSPRTEPSTPAVTKVQVRGWADTPAPEGGRFVDVTEKAGIDFVHNAGAHGKKYLPETMGPGCLFIDFDGDGYQDILILNGTDWPEKKEEATTAALYRNRGDGTFENVTEKAGLAREIYGMGGAVGDYDNDGDDDLYISAMGPDLLFRNDGDGTFTDVTKEAGMDNPDWGTSCAFLDYDRDGHLDLFVGNYVEWSIEKDIFCTLDGKAKSYCTPESYRGVSPRLFRNDGDGTFTDVTKASGVHSPASKSLGVAVLDYNGDGWPDILVANDTEPNKLFENLQDGTFQEMGTVAGIAYAEDGRARGAMGVDAADYDGSGSPSVVIGNFSNEMIGLYHNEGDGFFIDQAPVAGIGRASLLSLAFACFFLDYDLDGNLDIFAGNGHVEDDIGKVQRAVSFAQSPHLFRGDGEGHFLDVVGSMGEDLRRPIVARGGAWADIDNDGDPDLLVTTNRGPAYLFRNDRGEGKHWIQVKTVGTKSNRSGIGAKVTVVAGGKSRTLTVKSGASYCSQNQLPVLFGLGDTERVDRVEIVWPSGTTDVLSSPQIDGLLVVTEGSHPRR